MTSRVAAGRGLRWLLAVLVCVALWCTPVSANGPEVIDTGACLVPVTKSSVQLLHEWVTVQVPGDDGAGGDVSCRYDLHNPEAVPVQITMAFVVGDEGRLTAVAGLEDSEFSVKADGVEVPVQMRPIRAAAWTNLITYPPDDLPSWQVAIPARGSVDLRIGYHVWWDGSHTHSEDDDPYAEMRYHALAARLWSGSIASAEIEFDLSKAGGRFWRCLFDSTRWGLGKIEPEGYDWTDDGVKWVYHDWVPEHDFVVRLPYKCK